MMTDTLKEKLKALIENGCTDSDLEYFAENNNVDEGEVFQYAAELTVPVCCKGCKHVQLYDSMYPCTVCSRGKKDMYTF